MASKRASHGEGGRGSRKVSRTAPAAGASDLHTTDHEEDDAEEAWHAPPTNAVASSAQRTVEALAAAAAASASAVLSVDAAKERIAQIINRLMVTPSVYKGPPLIVPNCDGAEFEKVTELFRGEPSYTGSLDIEPSRLVLTASESKGGGSFYAHLTYAKDRSSAPEPLVLTIGPSVTRFARLFPYGNRAVDFPGDTLACKTIESLRYSAVITGHPLPTDPVSDDLSSSSDAIGMGHEFFVTKMFIDELCPIVAQLVWDNTALRKALLPFWSNHCAMGSKSTLEIYRKAFEGMEMPPEKKEHMERLMRGPTDDDIKTAFLQGVIASPLTQVEKSADVGGSTLKMRYWNMRIGGPVFSRVFSAEAKNMARGAMEAEADPLITAAYGYRDHAKSFGMVPEAFQFYASPYWSVPVGNRHAAAALLKAHPNAQSPAYVMAWNVMVSLSVTAKSVAVGKVNLVLRPKACWYLRPYTNVSRDTVVMNNPLASLGSSSTAVTTHRAMDDDVITDELRAALDAAEAAYADSEARRAVVGGAK